MNKKVEGNLEFLKSKCQSIEDWQKELDAIIHAEGLQSKVKKQIEKQIEKLTESQPKFYLNKVYGR